MSHKTVEEVIHDLVEERDHPLKRLRQPDINRFTQTSQEFEEEMTAVLTKHQSKKRRVQKATIKYGRLGAKCGKSKQETKFLDTSLTNLLSTTMEFVSLNTPLFGTEFYQRVGNSMCLKSISINGGLQYAYNAGAVQDYVRLAIVYDKQPNAAFPAAAATLFQEVYDSGSAASYAESGINPVNKDRFIVLWTKRFQVPGLVTAIGNTGGGGSPANNPPNIMVSINDLTIDVFKKLGGMETRFNTTNGGTIADITTGSLLWVTQATDNAPGTAAWTFYGTARLRFTD